MIEHPIVLINGVRFVEMRIEEEKPPHCLNECQWQQLVEAEAALYRHGDLGITDTNEREDCGVAADVWAYVETSMDAMFGEDLPESLVLRKMAERVARVFAVMAFGPEFLIR